MEKSGRSGNEKVRGGRAESFLMISSISVETPSRNHRLPRPECEREGKHSSQASTPSGRRFGFSQEGIGQGLCSSPPTATPCTANLPSSPQLVCLRHTPVSFFYLCSVNTRALCPCVCSRAFSHVLKEHVGSWEPTVSKQQLSCPLSARCI